MITKRIFHCICGVLACENAWDVSPNTGTLDGTFQAVGSVEECRDLCLADPLCVAIDVSSGVPFLCFLHTNDSLMGNEDYTSEIISQHALLNRCEPGN